tara:strand:- start:60 stop:302 length:243 start_codon:yes stop_codon:yes gene_type:complete
MRSEVTILVRKHLLGGLAETFKARGVQAARDTIHVIPEPSQLNLALSVSEESNTKSAAFNINTHTYIYDNNNNNDNNNLY